MAREKALNLRGESITATEAVREGEDMNRLFSTLGLMSKSDHGREGYYMMPTEMSDVVAVDNFRRRAWLGLSAEIEQMPDGTLQVWIPTEMRNKYLAWCEQQSLNKLNGLNHGDAENGMSESKLTRQERKFTKSEVDSFLATLKIDSNTVSEADIPEDFA